jgi:hypothetical protein
MKSTLLTSLIIFLSGIVAFGQQKGRPQQVDNNLIFNSPLKFTSFVPKGPHADPRLKQTAMVANLGEEAIIISTATAANGISHPNELDKYYDEVIKGFLEALGNPEITNRITIVVDSLVGETFETKVISNGKDLKYNVLVIIAGNTIYTFCLAFPNDGTQQGFTVEDLVKSIQFVGLKTEDQVKASDSIFTNRQKQGELFGYVVLIIAAVYFVIKEKRKKAKLKNPPDTSN